MTEAWQGKSMWIWELDKCEGGNVLAIIAQAKAAGLNSLIVKAHDGTSWWSQFSPSLIQAVHAAGLKIGAWGYCYGEDPAGEARQAIAALDMGADFYVADLETEFDAGSMWDAANKLMSAIKAGAKGKPVGYTSFALPQYHPGFPFSVVSKYADFTMPQVYWADLKLPPAVAAQTSIAYYRKFGVPIVPIGQSYGPVTPEQIKQFIDACAGLPGFSFWDWQHCTSQMWEAVISGKVVQEVANVLQLGSTGPEVQKLQHELNLVLGTHIAEDGVFGPETQSAVKNFQFLHHLTVDGIVGPETQAALDAAVKALSRYPSVNVEINGVKQPPGIAVNNVTYVNWGALDVVKVPYQYKGNGDFVIDGKVVQGVIQDNVTYLPWNVVLKGYTPERIDGGWNFVKDEPAPKPTNDDKLQQAVNLAQQVASDAQKLASETQQLANLLKEVQ